MLKQLRGLVNDLRQALRLPHPDDPPPGIRRSKSRPGR